MSDTELERRRLRVLIASVTLLLISGGGMYLIVVALKDVAMEFGWPRAVPSMAVSLLFIGSGIGGIFMGWVLDRWGFGVPALVGSIMAGLGGILGGKIDAAWQLYLIYGLMFGLSGQGSVAAPAMANIARWYDNVPTLWTQWVFSDRIDTPLLRNRHGDSSGVRGAAWLGI